MHDSAGSGPLRRLVAQQFGIRVEPARAGGVVHSVFARACNIQTRAGQLVALLAPAAGNLPHGIRCALPPAAAFDRWLVPGQKAVAGESSLSIPAAGILVDLSGATRWSGDLAAYLVDPQAGATLRAVRELLALLQRLARGGFASALPPRAAQSGELDRALRSRLVQALPLIAQGVGESDAVAVERALGLLVGLGPGLTPSGDDFIVGLLAGLWCRAAREQRLRNLLAALAEPLARLAGKTNAISRQFIGNAVAGQFSEPVVELVAALAGRAARDVPSSARTALRTGHSSGADTIVGLVFGLRPDVVIDAMRRVPARCAAFNALR
jgi:hypothetical protein